jgi:hypothetical protein
MRLSRIGNAAWVIVTALGLVILPMFGSARGPRASMFGWLAFALLTAVARLFTERAREAERSGLRVNARQRDLDRHAAAGFDAT